MKCIEETELKTLVYEMLDGVWAAANSELHSAVTGIGLMLYGHGGEVSIFLNTDDDQSFQAEAIEYFKSKQWGGFAIPELEGWSIEGEEFEFRHHDGTTIHGGHEAYKACFRSVVELTKNYISNVADGEWRPNYLVFEETPVGIGGFWECPGGIALPPQPPASQEALAVNGFREGEPLGLKIYSIGFTERKYCGLYLEREGPKIPKRCGIPVLKDWLKGVKAHSWSSHKRKGALARIDNMSFAIKTDAPREFKEWLRPFVEFLPLEDEDGQGWEIVHVLGDVVGASRKSREVRGKPALELTREEWLNVGRPIFRSSTGRDEQILIVVDGDTKTADFFDLAKAHDLRGVQFDLVWCEDTAFLRDRLHAAVEQIRDKAERYSGSRELTGRYSESWAERDFDYFQLDQRLKDHSELRGREGLLSVNLWHYYNV